VILLSALPTHVRPESACPMPETGQSPCEIRTSNSSGRAVMPWLTVEIVLYLGLGILALVLRLYALGRRPMQPEEARQALAAWKLLQGQPAQTDGCSPLMLTANMFVFLLLGANDASARLASALSGTALVMLPFGLRWWLSRRGALVAAILLALSPLALFGSRYLDGATTSAASVLLILIGLARWRNARRLGAVRLVSGGLAVLLLSGAGAYTVLLIMVSFGLLLWLVRSERVVWDSPQVKDHLWTSQSCPEGVRHEDWALALRGSGSLFVVIIGLIGTCFLLNPGGLQVLLDLPPAWARGLFIAEGGLSLHQYLALVPVYEPLVLVFGLVGLAATWRERDLFSLFLSYWAVIALLLTGVRADRGVDDALMLIIPLALLAGRFLGRRLPGWLSGASWEQDGFFVALACGLSVYAALQLSFFSYTGRSAYLHVAGVVGVLIVCLFASIAFWLGRQAASRSLCMWLVLILGIITLSAAIGVNYVRMGDPHELVLSAPISLDLRTLLDDVARLSAQRAIDEDAVDVALHLGLANPMSWYLRDYANLELVDSLGSTVDSTAVIAHLMAENPSLGGAYGGQDYLFRSWWDLATLQGSDWGQWLLYRKASTALREERVILWVQQE
jgi:uncharacterized protein (TIGR03663 family)